MNPAVSGSSFRQTLGLTQKPAVDVGFYFDLVHRAVVAVKFAILFFLNDFCFLAWYSQVEIFGWGHSLLLRLRGFFN